MNETSYADDTEINIGKSVSRLKASGLGNNLKMWADRKIEG